MGKQKIDKNIRNGIIAVAGFVAVLLAIVIPLSISVQKESAGSTQYLNLDGTDSATSTCDEDNCFISGFTPNPTIDGIIASGKVISVDPVLGTARFRFDWYPSGSYLFPGSTRRLAKNVTIHVDNTPPVNFKSGSVMGFTEVPALLFDGDVLRYPFDSHTAAISLSATHPEGNETIVVPIGTMLVGGLATYSLKADYTIYSTQGIAEKDTIEYQVTFNRSATTKFFAIVLGIVMWMLALSQVAVVLDKLFFRPERKVETGQLGVSTGILFALPGIRGAQPNAPPTGTVLDTATFFWCEVLVALCVVIQLWSWMLAWKAPEKKEDKKEEKKEGKTNGEVVVAKTDKEIEVSVASDPPVSSWITVDGSSGAVNKV